jgi:hypothetical protein
LTYQRRLKPRTGRQKTNLCFILSPSAGAFEIVLPNPTVALLSLAIPWLPLSENNWRTVDFQQSYLTFDATQRTQGIAAGRKPGFLLQRRRHRID